MLHSLLIESKWVAWSLLIHKAPQGPKSGGPHTQSTPSQMPDSVRGKGEAVALSRGHSASLGTCREYMGLFAYFYIHILVVVQ